MKKRVILHIGFPKTGSSALQAFLASNTERLAREGIGYPYPDTEHLVAAGDCSGNAIQILYKGGFMEGAGADADVGERLSDAYFDTLSRVVQAVPKPTVLVSGEILGGRSGAHFSRFLQKLGAYSDVEIICFVRDPFDLFFSAWRQNFKYKMNTPVFSRYIEKIIGGESEPPSMIAAFNFFHCSKVPIKVINYDHHKKNVASAFLNAIGCEKMGLEFSDTAIREINKSLTPSEVCLAQIAQEKISNPDFTAAFIRMALSREHRVALEYYNRGQHQSILDRFQDTIRLINSHLPEGEKLATETRDRADAEFVILPEDAGLLLELVKKLVAEGPKTPASPAAEPRAGAPSLPADFDPEAYLLHNPDVAAARMDPARHWLLHGWRENRRYKLF